MSRRICTVIGKDFRGYPKTITLEAESVYEAAVRAMDEISKDGGMVSELKVTIHEPVRTWKIQPLQFYHDGRPHMETAIVPAFVMSNSGCATSWWSN